MQCLQVLAVEVVKLSGLASVQRSFPNCVSCVQILSLGQEADSPLFEGGT